MRKVLIQYASGLFYKWQGDSAWNNRTDDPYDADDFSSYAHEKDVRAFAGKEPHELVEYIQTLSPTGRTPVFQDTQMDPLRATMLGREAGMTWDVMEPWALDKNPFGKRNPAYDYWIKGFDAGMAVNPNNTSFYHCNHRDIEIHSNRVSQES